MLPALTVPSVPLHAWTRRVGALPPSHHHTPHLPHPPLCTVVSHFHMCMLPDLFAMQTQAGSHVASPHSAFSAPARRDNTGGVHTAQPSPHTPPATPTLVHCCFTF